MHIFSKLVKMTHDHVVVAVPMKETRLAIQTTSAEERALTHGAYRLPPSLAPTSRVWRVPVAAGAT